LATYTPASGNQPSSYAYDTVGNLVKETAKNQVVVSAYNAANQLVSSTAGNQTTTYAYDKRGNRVLEQAKGKASSWSWDGANRLSVGTNEKGDRSVYTFNALGVRVNLTQVSHSGQSYARDYVVDYVTDPGGGEHHLHCPTCGAENWVLKSSLVEAKSQSRPPRQRGGRTDDQKACSEGSAP
jgi:YD repeat-containing protein